MFSSFPTSLVYYALVRSNENRAAQPYCAAVFSVVCCWAELLAPWPCECSHPQPSWKTTTWLLARVLSSRNPTPGTFLRSVLCSVPAAPGAVRRREPTTPPYHSFGFKAADLIGLFCCACSWDMSSWIQTGFPEVSKGTAGSVLALHQTNSRSAWKQQIWSGAKLLLLATSAAAELFGKVDLDLKCNSKSSHS